jgi:hypothetical protein
MRSSKIIDENVLDLRLSMYQVRNHTSESRSESLQKAVDSAHVRVRKKQQNKALHCLEGPNMYFKEGIKNKKTQSTILILVYQRKLERFAQVRVTVGPLKAILHESDSNGQWVI